MFGNQKLDVKTAFNGARADRAAFAKKVHLLRGRDAGARKKARRAANVVYIAAGGEHFAPRLFQ